VIAEALKTEGICILKNYLNPEKLRIYQDALSEIVAKCERQATTEENRLGKYDYNGIDFARHALFADLILDELILAAIEAYYARPIYLCLTKIQRLYPVKPYEEKAFQWHHDSKGKYVKAMWVLTDVPETGQRMSYVAGSHRIKHSWTTYGETRLSDAQARQLGKVVECSAPAGSVVVFDANGIHRGNRNQGPARDTAWGVYSSGRYRQGCDFDFKSLGHLGELQKRVLQRSRTASRGYGPSLQGGD
jgi:ectoine hydroxylase-related dioxygenase (phytanoyl-CoA dioxygenase family)